MARPREFELDDVLSNAMSAFWDNGYEATSITDLVEVTGLHKGSIYKAFGDKHTLFVQALLRYLERAHRFDIDNLNSSTSPKNAIKKWLLGDVMPCCGQSFKRGCLMVNTISEVAYKDPEVAQVIQGHLTELNKTLTAVIKKGQAMQEIRKDIPAKELAQLILSSLTGMITLTKCNTSQAIIQKNINNLLKLIET